MCGLCFTGKVLSINTHLSPISALGYGISPWTQASLLLMHYFMHFFPLEKITMQFFSQCCPQPVLGSPCEHLSSSTHLHSLRTSREFNSQLIVNIFPALFNRILMIQKSQKY